MLPIEDVTSLPLLYHLNSEPWTNPEAASLIYEMKYRRPSAEHEPIDLPSPGQESALMKLLRERRSCRQFLSRKMTLAELATLLGGACGIAISKQLGPAIKCFLRTAPSAGALFPLDLYLATQEIEGMEPGLQHYDVLNHSLKILQRGPVVEEVAKCLLEPKSVRNANAVILISACFEPTLKKYGARGYRYILLEAGHVAQNLCLLATAQGLGSLCVGGFIDSRLNRLL